MSAPLLVVMVGVAIDSEEAAVEFVIDSSIELASKLSVLAPSLFEILRMVESKSRQEEEGLDNVIVGVFAESVRLCVLDVESVIVGAANTVELVGVEDVVPASVGVSGAVGFGVGVCVCGGKEEASVASVAKESEIFVFVCEVSGLKLRLKLEREPVFVSELEFVVVVVVVVLLKLLESV